MAKHDQAAKAKSDEKSRPKAQQAIVAELDDELIGLAEYPFGPISAGGGSIQAQAARLGDPRLQGTQRRALAAQIGRVQGNRHLQRVVASLEPGKKTTNPTHARQCALVNQAVQRKFRSEAVQDVSAVHRRHQVSQIQRTPDNGDEGRPVPYSPPGSAVDEIALWLRRGQQSVNVGPPMGTLTSPGRYSSVAHPADRFLLFASRVHVVFQDNTTGRFYTQTTRGFVEDVGSISAAYIRGGRGARGMAVLAEAEVEFLKGVLSAIPGVGLAVLAVDFLRHGILIHQHWDEIRRAGQLIYSAHNWMAQNAPNTYQYVVRTLLIEVGRHLPDAFDVPAVARIVGTLIGSLGTGALAASSTLLRVFLRALGAALRAVPGAVAGGAVRAVTPTARQVRNAARRLVRHAQQQGIEIAMDTAREIAREFVRQAALPDRLDELMRGLQILSGLADPIRANIQGGGAAGGG